MVMGKDAWTFPVMEIFLSLKLSIYQAPIFFGRVQYPVLWIGLSGPLSRWLACRYGDRIQVLIRWVFI